LNSRRDPFFSIIMPAYDAARTIGPAIESVLAQTLSDFELIVVDDGSTDETVARVRPYLSDERVRLISQPNRGLPAARNAAIETARGTYVSLLDSDDLWLPHYLEVMARTLRDHPSAAVAYTDAWVLDDETRRIARGSAMSPWHPESVPGDPKLFLRALIEFGNFVFVGATIHRSTLAKVGAFRIDLESVEDYELWLRVAAHGYRFVRCPGRLAIYRQSMGQMSANRPTMVRAYREVLRIVAEEYDVSDEIRQLANWARERDQAFNRTGRGRPRRVPSFLRRPYKAVSVVRRFHVRQPVEVRRAFPELREK
jgi:glycosyltransferase involved in cell wall biosynthesis